MGGVSSRSVPNPYPFQFGFQRDHNCTVSFEKIQVSPKVMVYNTNRIRGDLLSAYFSIYPNYIPPQILQDKNIDFNYIRSRVQGIMHDAKTRHHSAASTFISNPHLPNYPKMCGSNQIMASLCCCFFCPCIVLPARCCIYSCDICCAHSDQQIIDWNNETMQRFPHHDSKALDDHITTMMQQLITELNNRYNMLGYFFEYSFQPQCLVPITHYDGHRGSTTYSQVWDRFMIIITNSPAGATAPPSLPSNQTTIYDSPQAVMFANPQQQQQPQFLPPQPYQQQYQQQPSPQQEQIVYTEAVAIPTAEPTAPYDYGMNQPQIAVATGGEIVMVSLNTGPSIMQPAASFSYAPMTNSTNTSSMPRSVSYSPGHNTLDHGSVKYHEQSQGYSFIPSK